MSTLSLMTNEIYENVVELTEKGHSISFCYRKLKDQKKIFYSSFPSFYAAVKHERERRASSNSRKIPLPSSSLVLPSTPKPETPATPMSTLSETPRIQIKAETVFRASDNSIHPERIDAEIHELSLNLRRKFIEQGIQDERGEIKRLCAVITKNFDTFSPILTKIKSANSRKKSKGK